MRTRRLEVAAVLAVLCASLAAVPASADWSTGQPYKWLQMPDLGDTGLDVSTTKPFIVADDFQCDTTGPLTDVHIWGSWYHDALPGGDMNAVTFTLCVHEDIPAGTGGIPYSRPGAVIWERKYPPGTFTARLYQAGLYEGWLNPPSDYESYADTKCYQYNFLIPTGELRQTGTTYSPKIYWLAVQAVPGSAGSAFLGWKTSINHWNDAAAWAEGTAPYVGPWNELRYPEGHPYKSQKIDLAFVVNGETDRDWGDAPDSPAAPGYPTLKSHDGARHKILDGLHLGSAIDYETDGQPNSSATGDDLADADDEDGVGIPTLAPGATVTVEVEVELDPLSKRAHLDAWLDCNKDGDWADAGEQVFVSREVAEGENELDFTVPASTLTGDTFMRFRLSLAGGLAPTGEAPDGEVEDYQVVVAEPYDYGDAPEGAEIGGPSGVIGEFPTCTATGPGSFIRHAASEAWFGPMVDMEGDGNAGACLLYGFGDYDQDECGQDGDAGIIRPLPLTITGAGSMNRCGWGEPPFLGGICEIAKWGDNIDIDVHNWLPGHAPYAQAYVNVLIDWNADGRWSGLVSGLCGDVPEHVLVDFPIPPQYDGPLSALGPPDFVIAPRPGTKWTRFSITEAPVGTSDWDGSGEFAAGETEDYLLSSISRDYGDAPEPYPTLREDNGASHTISGSIRLGADIDSNLDGQPDPDALGDDNDGTDDEDGVDFVTPLVPGETAVVDVAVIGDIPAYVNAWIDFNQDGDWADADDHVFVDELLPEDTHHLSFTVPDSAVPGVTYARFRASEDAGLSYVGAVIAGEVEDYKVTIELREEAAVHELGDAPDSANSFGIPMTAYPAGGPPGVVAKFPTNALTPAPHTGPLHLSIDSGTDAWLGLSFSLESNADCGPDEDLFNNIVPVADAPNNDLCDDGVIGPISLPNCQPTNFNYALSLAPGVSDLIRWYINVWFDWNRDGDWDDTLECPDGAKAPEWAVQDEAIPFLPPGVYVLQTPDFAAWHPGGDEIQPIWMRITLADEPWPGGAGGCGPEDFYQYGETEDYYFTPTPSDMQLDYGDAPDPLYPTLFMSNGAKHRVVPTVHLGAGIDAENDGQPDADALGDDSAGVDDEDGITFLTPLLQGRPTTVGVAASVAGKVDAWIDFNGNGSWADAGERIFSGLAVPAGSSTQSFTVPTDAAPGSTFARFRFSTGGVDSYDGYAPDGEVEDYEVEIERVKWIQLPDLTTEGMDVNASVTNSPPYILADDFECVSLTPVSDVHIWGSWLHDILPTDGSGNPDPANVYFCLSIHEDVPAGTGGIPYSRPGQMLKRWDFNPYTFEVRRYAENLTEGWYNPPEAYDPAGDTTCWQYDFTIPQGQWFLQQGTPEKPTIYWLDVQAKPMNNPDARFGWKTSKEQWNDAAVWGNGQEPFAGPWNPLAYPSNHPKKGLPTDMAFAITGPAQDFGDAPDPYPTLMANNGASHCIVDGFCLGSKIDAEPDGQPDTYAYGDDNNGLDDEDGLTHSVPRVPLCPAEIEITASQAGKLDAWIDFNDDGDWDDAGEKIANSVALAAGPNTITYDVPDVPGSYDVGARLRYSSTGGLPYYGPALDGEVEDYSVHIWPRPVVCTIGEAKQLPLGSYVLLRDEVVTADFGLLTKPFYIQEQDGSAGIQVFMAVPDPEYSVGDIICCYGVTSRLAGEMYVNPIHTWLVSLSSVAPVGQTNRAAGGGAVFQTPPPDGLVNQPAVLDIASALPGGPLEASGLSSVGLLVKVWGVCTHIQTTADPAEQLNFWLDDGSSICDGTVVSGAAVKGIKVKVPEGLTNPIVEGDYYSVTGIMRADGPMTECVRWLWPRSADDITPVTP